MTARQARTYAGAKVTLLLLTIATDLAVMEYAR